MTRRHIVWVGCLECACGYAVRAKVSTLVGVCVSCWEHVSFLLAGGTKVQAPQGLLVGVCQLLGACQLPASWRKPNSAQS